jgi:hypothetical protein
VCCGEDKNLLFVKGIEKLTASSHSATTPTKLLLMMMKTNKPNDKEQN